MELNEAIDWVKANKGKIIIDDSGNVMAIEEYRFKTGEPRIVKSWTGQKVKHKPDQHCIFFKTTDLIGTTYGSGVWGNKDYFIVLVEAVQRWRSKYIKTQSALRLFKNDYVDAII